MPSGTALYAARSGLVTHRTLGILGIAVADKEVDYYIHGAYPVLLGSIVKQGQQIGLSGNIMPGGGYTTGPHLHFERQGPGGYINEPSTSRDPAPILFPDHFTAPDGTITADMTDDQALMLKNTTDKTNEVWELLRTGIHAAASPRWIYDELQAVLKALGELKEAVAAIPAGSAPADNAAVLTAIANVQTIVDKIDRGE